MLVHATNCYIRMGTLVLGIVIDRRRPLGQRELRHSGVLLVRDLLAIEGFLDVVELLEHLGRNNCRACICNNFSMVQLHGLKFSITHLQ